MTTEQLQLSGLAVDRVSAPGPKILFVHGAHAGSWYWTNFLHDFAAAGYDAYALNLRGHGANRPLPALGRVGMRDYAADVVAVLAELGEDCILVGHSMGGSLVQMVAARHPVAALVMAASGPVAGVAFQRPPATFWGALYGLANLPRLARRGALRPGYRVTRRAVLNRLPADQHWSFYSRLGPESSTAALEVLRGEVEGDLRGRPFPRLVISGSDDRAVVMAMEHDLAAAQQADLIELNDHGHVFMLEPGWQECAALMRQWLDHQGLAASAPRRAQG